MCMRLCGYVCVVGIPEKLGEEVGTPELELQAVVSQLTKTEN